MYWQKKSLNYDIVIPPISKPFEKFNLSETETYFKWYMDQLCNRIKYLQDYSNTVLNFSVDSLVDIWGWFLKVAEIEKTPKIKMNEVKRQLKGQPKEIVEAVLKEGFRTGDIYKEGMTLCTTTEMGDKVAERI